MRPVPLPLKILFRNSKGQSITEFALILPLLLIMIGGVVDFGLAFFVGQVIENASREGARAGAVIPPAGPVSASGTLPSCRTDTDPVIQAACSRIPDSGLFDGFTVTSSGVEGAVPDQSVTVTVTGTYSWFLLQLIPAFLDSGATTFSGPITITRSTTMRWEWQS